MSDLEELARQGRAKKPSANPTPPKAAEPPPVNEAELKRARQAIISATPLGSVLAGMLAMVVVAGISALIAYLAGLDLERIPVVAGVLGVLTMLLWVLAVSRVVFARERRWMEALPYRLSFDSYLKALGKERRQTKVRLVLRFAEPIPDGRRRMLRDAGSGSHPDAKGEIDDEGALVITTRCQTHFPRPAGSDMNATDPYRNHLVHRFVRAVLRGGVPIIHSAHPIKSISIRLSSGG